MENKCRLCCHKILSHAFQVKCCLCNGYYHVKCITLVPEEMQQLRCVHPTWYCRSCNEEIFPFNNISDDGEFLECLLTYYNSKCPIPLPDDDMIFQPFELDSDLRNRPHEDIDPDINFYNEITYNVGLSCKYYSEDTFLREIKERNLNDSQCLSLCHTNIRSAKQNLVDFDVYIKGIGHQFHIVGLTETWLQDYNSELYGIDGYKMIEKHRKDKKGGGVAILLKENINFMNRTDLDIIDDANIESIFIELDKDVFQYDSNVLVGVIYRPPGTDMKLFNEQFGHILDTIRKEKKICYLMGDYNINILNSDTHETTGCFVDMLYGNSFIPLINRPTRVTKQTATLIDNIYTNNLKDVSLSYQGLLVTDISDHFPIFHIHQRPNKIEKDVTSLRRSFSNRNKQNFLKALNENNWNEIYMASGTQSAFTSFHAHLTKLYNSCFPLKEYKTKYNNRKPWLSDALRNSIKIKNKLYAKYLKTKSIHNEKTYKDYKNKLTRLLKVAEKKYFNDLLMANKNNMKKTWSIIKGIINKNRVQRCNKKFKIDDNNVLTDPVAICNQFNNFFVNIGPTLAKKIPKHNNNPQQYLGDRILNSIYLSPVNESEINKIVSQLKDNSPGYDGIKSSVLKLSMPSLCGHLTYLCNLSLLEGVFPDELKKANVIPLFKSGDPMTFSNYRPVSLLPVLSKVFEKVMYARLLDFLKEHKLLFKYQFGFREHHSTYMALMVLMDKLIKSLENGEYVVGVFLDFSKAFDTVDHAILLMKLSHYGVRGPALEWFVSYLRNRTQYVTYNGHSSEVKRITCGVPQGSILGPLLFLIYINDLYRVCSHTMPILFADDSNLFSNNSDLHAIENMLNQELADISGWLKANKLSLNVKKTHYMIFSKDNLRKHDLSLSIDGEVIARTSCTKFLGVYIDDKLCWKNHIAYISNKISKGLGILIKARQYLSKSTLVQLYYSFVYPYINYCNHIWGSTYATRLNRLVLLQKKAVRIISNAKAREHTGPLFEKLGILNVLNINKYVIGCFMFRYHKGKLPELFDDYFVMNESVHNYGTRQANHLHVPKVKTEFSKAGIRYKGVHIWNNILGLGIDTDVSECTFKRYLKKVILAMKM